jgi:heme A synthase
MKGRVMGGVAGFAVLLALIWLLVHRRNKRNKIFEGVYTK